MSRGTDDPTRFINFILKTTDLDCRPIVRTTLEERTKITQFAGSLSKETPLGRAQTVLFSGHLWRTREAARPGVGK